MMKTHLQIKDSKGNCFSGYRFAYRAQMSGEEQLQIELALGEKDDINKAKSLLGEMITCQLFDNPQGKGEPLISRSGLVSYISQTPFSNDRLLVTAEPFIVLLQHSRRFRVFQNKTTEEIVKAVLDEDGFASAYKMGKLPSTKREFCLQFDESDRDFVCRLLAQEGIHYFNKQLKDKYEIQFHDGALPFEKGNVVKLATDNKPDKGSARLSQWQQVLQFQAKQTRLGSWDERKGKWIESKMQNAKQSNSANKKLLHYHYPAAMIGATCDSSAANALAKKRLDEQQSNTQSYYGITDSYQIAVGQTVEVKGQGKFLVTGIEESFAIDPQGEEQYQCQFQAIADGERFLPEFIAKPQVNAVHSALVVGSNKAKPNHDDKGRVRVKFHWDETTGDKTSCWLRVAQVMAGKSYGFQFMPREGQEVLVSFLGGDPDKPMITGCVYNEQMPLPDAKASSTVSTIRTQLDGKANEIALDDKKDAEKFSVNAGRDYELTVGKDASHTITGESKTKISKKYSLTVEDEAQVKVSKKASTESKTYIVTAEDELKLVVGDNQIVLNKNGIEIKGKKIEVSADKACTTKAESITHQATKTLSGKAKDIEHKANGSLTQNSNMAMTLDSKNAITLSCVQNMGLTAKAGQLSAEGKLGTSIKGLKVDIAGQAMANVKAPLVKIN